MIPIQDCHDEMLFGGLRFFLSLCTFKCIFYSFFFYLQFLCWFFPPPPREMFFNKLADKISFLIQTALFSPNHTYYSQQTGFKGSRHPSSRHLCTSITLNSAKFSYWHETHHISYTTKTRGFMDIYKHRKFVVLITIEFYLVYETTHLL